VYSGLPAKHTENSPKLLLFDRQDPDVDGRRRSRGHGSTLRTCSAFIVGTAVGIAPQVSKEARARFIAQIPKGRFGPEIGWIGL
jgi:hypothetical protein